MGHQGKLLALDASAARLRGLEATADLQGVQPGFVTARAADLRSFSAECAAGGEQPFDKVLLDVPCSGLGVLAKRADMRWRRSPADVAAAAALQVQTTCGSFLAGTALCPPFRSFAACGA